VRRTAPQVAKDLAVRYAKVPGVHIRVDEEKCVGCKACVRDRYCLVDAITVQDRKASVDQVRCRQCGRCTHFCKFGALVAYGFAPDAVRRARGAAEDLMEAVVR